MNRRALLALFVIALAARAEGGSRVRIDPPPPFYSDDRVRITIQSDYPYPPKESFSVRGDGLSLERVYDGSGVHQWEATFYSDSGSGVIEITAPPPLDGPARVPFTILPPLNRPWNDPAEQVRHLVASRRLPAIVVAEASTLRPYVGQTVVITWWHYQPIDLEVQLSHYDERLQEYPAAPSPSDSHQERMVPLAGIMMKRRRIRAVAVTPKEPGRVTIPAMQFHGEGGGQAPFLRLANAIELDAQPLPAAAKGLPIGPFTIECQSTGPGLPERYWPSQAIVVRGGTLDMVQSFAFEGPPKYGIVLHPPVSDEVGKHWIMYAHERQLMEMPRPMLRYFDPNSGTAQTATCKDAAVPRPADPEGVDAASLIRTPKERRELRQAEARQSAPRRGGIHPSMMETALQSARAIAFILAAIGLIGLIAAFRA